MNDLLTISLSAAVPLWIARLKEQPWPVIQARAAECGQIVAEKGDIIQFKSEKKGETAKAFNALAEGLACLAFAPGGVKFAGLHFEATHPNTEKKEVAPQQERFKCPDCKAEGWYTPSALHVVDPRYDHARPDGRRCRKAEKRKPKA